MKVLNDLIPTDQIVTNNGSKKFLGFLITQGPGVNEVPFKIEQISTECVNTAWNTLDLDILNSFNDSGITNSNATISSLDAITDLRSGQFGQRNPPVRVCEQDPSGQINNLFAISFIQIRGTNGLYQTCKPCERSEEDNANSNQI